MHAPRVVPHVESLPERALLYVGFAMTGVAVAMPGVLMPWLLTHWALRDGQAGLLLFLFFVGCTGGALVSVGSPRASIVRGSFCTSVGAGLFLVASRAVAYPAILILGLGLGIVMTSISLLQARRWAGNSVAEITRLNLAWAMGACASPWLVLRAGVLDGAYERRALAVLTLMFASLGACSLALQKPRPCAEPRTTSRGRLTAVPFPLLLLVFCATGVEAASGGWLATYSQRGGHSLGVTIGAPTCLWAGLLTSRLLHSAASVGRAARPFLLTWNLLGMTLAIAAMLYFQQGPALVMAAFAIGFAAGPMYPLLLALVLERSGGNGVFVLAGFGSASLPLLTGLVSTHMNSLRDGLFVPGLAALTMAIAGWRAVRTGLPAGAGRAARERPHASSPPVP